MNPGSETRAGGDRGPRRAAPRLLAAALACLAGAACTPADPMDERVDAGTYLDFSMWRSGAVGRMTPAQVADFDESIQEIRFHVMAEGKASGSGDVEGAMLEAVDGLSVRDVLKLGLGWELARATDEKEAIEASMRQNALLRTNPGDGAAANYLADLNDRQAARLKAAADQVSHTRARLAAEAIAVELPDERPERIP
jgi:hypothetical protein